MFWVGTSGVLAVATVFAVRQAYIGRILLARYRHQLHEARARHCDMCARAETDAVRRDVEPRAERWGSFE